MFVALAPHRFRWALEAPRLPQDGPREPRETPKRAPREPQELPEAYITRSNCYAPLGDLLEPSRGPPAALLEMDGPGWPRAHLGAKKNQ
eukprot:235216-Pyramimonas_sp.AAC.1